jgi:hypothetical protein
MVEPDSDPIPIRKMVRRILLFAALIAAVMAAVLITGKLAGGAYWIGSVALCVLLYVVLTARAAIFRQRLAQWRSRKRQIDNKKS